MQMHKSLSVQINAFCVARQTFRYNLSSFLCLCQSLWFFFITCIAYRRIKSLEIIKHEHGVLKWKRILPLSLTTLFFIQSWTTKLQELEKRLFQSESISNAHFIFTVNKSDMFVIYFARYNIIQ